MAGVSYQRSFTSLSNHLPAQYKYMLCSKERPFTFRWSYQLLSLPQLCFSRGEVHLLQSLWPSVVMKHKKRDSMFIVVTMAKKVQPAELTRRWSTALHTVFIIPITTGVIQFKVDDSESVALSRTTEPLWKPVTDSSLTAYWRILWIEMGTLNKYQTRSWFCSHIVVFSDDVVISSIYLLLTMWDSMRCFAMTVSYFGRKNKNPV